MANCRGLEDGSVVTWVFSVLRDGLMPASRRLLRDVGTLCFVMNCRCMEVDSVVCVGDPVRCDGLVMAVLAPSGVGVCTSRRVDGVFVRSLWACPCVPLAVVPVLCDDVPLAGVPVVCARVGIFLDALGQ